MTRLFRTAMATAIVFALQASGARAGDWDSCAAAPTRACALALAADEAMSNDDADDKVRDLGRLAVAETEAGLVAEADRDFAAAAAIIAADDGVGVEIRRAQRNDLLAASLADAGRVDAALGLTAKIEPKYPATALATIAVRQARRGDGAQAAATASLAAERSRTVTLPMTKFDAFRTAALAERAAGRAKEAIAAEGDAIAAVQFGADALMRDYERRRIAEDQAARGDDAAAQTTISGFESPAERERATFNLAMAAASAGRLDESASIVNSLSTEMKFAGLILLARTQSKFGPSAVSTAAAAEVRRIVAAAGGAEERARRLADLASLEAALGDQAAAAADFAAARAQYESVSAERRPIVAARLAHALAAAGRTAEALALQGELRAGASRDFLLDVVADEQIRAGAHADALRSIKSISMQDLRLPLLEEAAGALPR